MNRIKYLSNAGVAIEYKNTRLIFDGLYSDYNHPFSPMEERAFNYCINSRFKDYDNYLFFTHYHPDHFSFSRVMKFFKVFPDSGIVIPLTGDGEKHILKEGYLAKNLYYNTEIEYRVSPEIKVEFFITAHSGDEYKGIFNICYLVAVENSKILITGDTDFINEDFGFLEKENLDAILVNPLFYLNGHGKKKLMALNGRVNIIYHIPFENDDIYNFRKLVNKGLKRDMERGRNNILPFYSYGQYLELDKIGVRG